MGWRASAAAIAGTAVITTAVACAAGPLVGGGGLHVESVTTEAFDAIELSDEFSADLDIDTTMVPVGSETYTLELAADENLWDFISVVVEDSVLRIESELVIEPAEPPTIIGDVPVLARVFLRDRAVAELDYFTPPPDVSFELRDKSVLETAGEFERVFVLASGRTKAELVGSATQIEIEVEGDDVVDARLEVEDAVVHMDGGGEVYICVTGVLDVTVSGSGVVTYGCDPGEVNETVTGSGRVQRAAD